VARVRIPPDTNMLLYLVDDEPVTGLWCDRCALPSAVEALFLVEDDLGVVPLGCTVRVRVCPDCGRAVQLPSP
jgi:hypothetical protein